MSLERVGRDLLDRSDSIAARAVGLLDSHRAVDRVLVEDATVVLCDRIALSLALSRAIGLRTWGMRESIQLGRVVALDVVCACVDATFGEMVSYENHQAVHFLETLRDTTIDAVLGSTPPSEEHDDAAEILLAALGARDITTCEHSRATAVWTRRLCMAMGIEASSARFTELCALVHDVGKIALHDAVLFKPGPLDAKEWDTVREHPAVGQRILESIPSLRPCSLVVRAHHERFDGSGYPDGLVGTGIVLEARIVAVADAFHAMISERPHRHAHTPQAALEILREGRGTQWDSAIVDEFLSMFEERGEQIEERPAWSMPETG